MHHSPQSLIWSISWEPPRLFLPPTAPDNEPGRKTGACPRNRGRISFWESCDREPSLFRRLACCFASSDCLTQLLFMAHSFIPLSNSSISTIVFTMAFQMHALFDDFGLFDSFHPPVCSRRIEMTGTSFSNSSPTISFLLQKVYKREFWSLSWVRATWFAEAPGYLFTPVQVQQDDARFVRSKPVSFRESRCLKTTHAKWCD